MRAFDLTVSGSLVLEGGGTSVSGSSTSTGSFGRAYLGEQVTFSSTQNTEKILLGETDIGIANKDGADMVLFADANGEILFADGGRTGNVKMAIDFAAGGVSIGNNVHSKTPPTSGLMVEGNISGSVTSTGSFGALTVGGTTLNADLISDRVGINTTAPAAELHVNSSGTTQIRMSAGDASSDSRIEFYQTTSAKGFVGFNDGTDTMVINYGSDIDATTGLHINSSGRVGIGTTTPGVALEVRGSISGSATGSFHRLEAVGNADVAGTLTAGTFSPTTISANKITASKAALLASNSTIGPVLIDGNVSGSAK